MRIESSSGSTLHTIHRTLSRAVGGVGDPPSWYRSAIVHLAGVIDQSGADPAAVQAMSDSSNKTYLILTEDLAVILSSDGTRVHARSSLLSLSLAGGNDAFQDAAFHDLPGGFDLTLTYAGAEPVTLSLSSYSVERMDNVYEALLRDLNK